jgi:2-amino-4-hydroxy-6-hydroxymethyldihydropteridine diphosphokinase
MARIFMAEAFIALGGNIGDVRATFDKAIACLCRDEAVRLVARSSDYRTPPWGMTEQPPFINATIAVVTSFSPRDLLKRTMDCERQLGLDRARKQHWGPRNIDIDILSYDDLVLAAPAHAGAGLRARAACGDRARSLDRGDKGQRRARASRHKRHREAATALVVPRDSSIMSEILAQRARHGILRP